MAGGKGTRLSEITRGEIPKGLVPVHSKPILQWQIEALKQNGIKDILIITGYLGEKIRSAFGNGDNLGVKIEYFNEMSPLGTAGALPLVRPFITEENFLLVLGDCVFDVDINRMASFHSQNHALATLFAHPNSHPNDSDLLMIGASGCVTSFHAKSEPKNGWYDNMVNAGLYILSRKVCNNIPNGRADLEKDFLFPEIPNGRIFGYISSEYIKDTGTPERIIKVASDLAAGTVAARNLRRKQKCIFADRDGTINYDKGLIYKTEDFELLPTAAKAIRTLNDAGFLVIVITNQPVVARNLCGTETVDEIHRKMKTLLGAEGAYVDDVYYCPHHPDMGYPEENPAYKIQCECRKPGIGMIKQAVDRYNISLERSWITGDTSADIQTGKNAGLKTILVRTGMAGSDGKYSAKPDIVCKDLLEAAQFIINNEV